MAITEKTIKEYWNHRVESDTIGKALKMARTRGLQDD